MLLALYICHVRQSPSFALISAVFILQAFAVYIRYGTDYACGMVDNG